MLSKTIIKHEAEDQLDELLFDTSFSWISRIAYKQNNFHNS